MAKIQEVITSKFHFEKQETAPSIPPTGTVIIYAKADGKMYAKDSGGTEVALTAPDISNLATLLNGSAAPVANADYRGKFYLINGDPGNADILKVCVKKSDDSYGWLTVGLT